VNKTSELSATKATFAMFRRDCLHYFHKPSQIFNPLLFFFMVTAAIPFAIDTSEFQLSLLGPGHSYESAATPTSYTRKNMCSLGC